MTISRSENKPAGYYSRRHHGRDEQEAAREAYKSEHSKESRQGRAEANRLAWAKLSPAEQLADLDQRLGKGVGAVKQRAQIQALIDNPTAGEKLVREIFEKPAQTKGSKAVKQKESKQ